VPSQENELGQEKTEKGTGRRREKQREQGQVARSKELNSAVILFSCLCLFAAYGSYFLRLLKAFMHDTFLHFPEISISDASLMGYGFQVFFFYLKVIAPIFIVFILVGIIANLSQYGWLFTTKTLFRGMKNFNLNPAKFVQKIFSTKSFVDLGISMLKVFFLALIVYRALKDELYQLPHLVSIPIEEAFMYISLFIAKLAIKLIVFLLIIGIIDLVWQRFSHEKGLKMSKQEIKDEMKMMEGDPAIKRQVRSAQMKMMVSRMVQQVPEADVVITNPVHVAIAIQYKSDAMGAPLVLAKGARLIAERIKSEARAAGVPIVENKPLAQTIYKTIDVGAEIPPDLYQAVAEVLAYVYKLNDQRMTGSRPAGV